MSRLALLAALLVAPAIAQATPSAQPTSQLGLGAFTVPVIGGGMVPPGKWPDAVAVLGATGSCTGTLIAPDVVLTAGHCANINPDQVVVDTTNYNGAGGKRIAIESITAYPDYRKAYDVAVIVLKQPVEGVAPRKVGRGCTFTGFAEETMVHLVGFGLTQEDGGGANTSLREAMAPVLDPTCAGGNGCRDGASPAGEFVAGGGGADSCFGDSGGPVYLDTERGAVVIASVSRGLDDSPMPCGGGGIYVRTDKLIRWIEETTARVIAKDDCIGDDETDANGSGDEGGGDDRSASFGGGCSSTSNAAWGAVFLLLPIALLRRYRRRTARRS
jgi:secreted trypsin-like serine protease